MPIAYIAANGASARMKGASGRSGERQVRRAPAREHAGRPRRPQAPSVMPAQSRQPAIACGRVTPRSPSPRLRPARWSRCADASRPTTNPPAPRSTTTAGSTERHERGWTNLDRQHEARVGTKQRCDEARHEPRAMPFTRDLVGTAGIGNNLARDDDGKRRRRPPQISAIAPTDVAPSTCSPRKRDGHVDAEGKNGTEAAQRNA